MLYHASSSGEGRGGGGRGAVRANISLPVSRTTRILVQTRAPANAIRVCTNQPCFTNDGGLSPPSHFRYDYKTLVDPGLAPTPKFPSPQGFKWNTGNRNNSCCWVWLIDSDTQEPETMEKIEVGGAKH